MGYQFNRSTVSVHSVHPNAITTTWGTDRLLPSLFSMYCSHANLDQGLLSILYHLSPLVFPATLFTVLLLARFHLCVYVAIQHLKVFTVVFLLIYVKNLDIILFGCI